MLEERFWMCLLHCLDRARARLSGLRQSVNVHISISVGRSVLRMARWEAGLVPTPPSPTALSATGSIHHPPPRRPGWPSYCAACTLCKESRVAASPLSIRNSSERSLFVSGRLFCVVVQHETSIPIPKRRIKGSKLIKTTNVTSETRSNLQYVNLTVWESN